MFNTYSGMAVNMWRPGLVDTVWLLWGSGTALRKEISSFPTLLMDLPADCDLVAPIKKAQKTFSKLGEKLLAGWFPMVLSYLVC